jgi:hypothetical protein
MRLFEFKRHSLLILSLSFLVACEIGGEKREVPQDDSVLTSYFFSEQYAIADNDLREALSFMFGAVIAARPSSNFQLWTQPPLGCFASNSYWSAASNNVGIRRMIDVGTLKLRLPTNQVVNFSKSGNLDYFHTPAVAEGLHTIQSDGVSSGALKFDLPFVALSSGENITAYTTLEGEEDALIQPLSSPAIPSEDEPSHTLVFNRLTTNALTFDAPAQSHYVRVRLKDGSNTSSGDITCLGRVDEALIIPQGALYAFRTGTQGHIEIDFVRVDSISNVSRLKTGIVLSSIRHFQGTFEYMTQDGIKITDNVGLVEFR